MAEDIVAVLNALPGWTKEMGIVILTATPDEVSCAFEVREKHHQGFGIAHGGVHAGWWRLSPRSVRRWWPSRGASGWSASRTPSET